MYKRVVVLIGIAIVFVVGFLLSTRPVPVQGQTRAGSGFAAVPGEKGGQDYTGPYEVVADWPKPMTTLPGHEKWSWSTVQGIFAQNPNRVFIIQRGELPVVERPREVIALPQIGPSIGFPVSQYPIRNGSQGPYSALPGGGGDTTRYGALGPGEPAAEWKGKVGVDARWEHCIVVVDAAGNILPETEIWAQWDKKLLRRPHAAYVSPYDPQKHVWIVDDASHALYKFSSDGKQLVQTVGTVGIPGSDATHFNRPTFLAWLPDGSMFVSDGYANTRVAKFDKDGKFLMDWGQKGSAGQGRPPDTRPGYFNTVHGVATDPQTRRVYVNDRANRRIQVFDENGKFLDQWSIGPVGSIYTIYFSEGKLWGADATTRKIIAWDTQGYLQYAWGSEGQFPGGTDGVHGLSVDQEGNLYMAELFIGRAMKFRPRRGADPAKLVGKPVYAAWRE